MKAAVWFPRPSSWWSRVVPLGFLGSAEGSELLDMSSAWRGVEPTERRAQGHRGEEMEAGEKRGKSGIPGRGEGSDGDVVRMGRRKELSLILRCRAALLSNVQTKCGIYPQGGAYSDNTHSARTHTYTRTLARTSAFNSLTSLFGIGGGQPNLSLPRPFV